jgi:basic membrane lipoprotein Med (substrate-binding protein (PBP1-ABC) superfamily)
MLAAVVSLVAVVTFVVLVAIGNRPPEVVFLFAGDDFGGWNSQMLAGVDVAGEEYEFDVAIKTSSEFGVPYERASVIESDPDLVINGMASQMAGEAGEIESAHPAIRFVHPDVAQLMDQEEIDGNPHISFPVFPVHEGSFLVGVAAARMTETGVVGFIGGMDGPLIREFEGGFAAGVEHVERESGSEIEVLVEYLTPAPWFDFGGFSIPSLAFEVASEMHASDADVIYTAAGGSGFGALLAARMSTLATGIHRWHIGVDQDEYVKFEAMGSDSFGPFEASDALPHILTSMQKRVGVSVNEALRDYHNGIFRHGVVVYGLAEGGVGYVTRGGHIDHLVPELERLKGMIVAGEIEVPRYPKGYEPPEFEEEG